MGSQLFSLLQFMTFAHCRNAYHEWIDSSVRVPYCVLCILSFLHSNLLAHCVVCESSLTVQFQRLHLWCRREKGMRNTVGMLRKIPEWTFDLDEELLACCINWQKVF